LRIYLLKLTEHTEISDMMTMTHTVFILISMWLSSIKV